MLAEERVCGRGCRDHVLQLGAGSVGILAEGMSRVVFERGLASLTAERFAGRGQAVKEALGDVFAALPEARQKMGPVADALALDQIVRSPRARQLAEHFAGLRHVADDSTARHRGGGCGAGCRNPGSRTPAFRGNGRLASQSTAPLRGAPSASQNHSPTMS